MVYRAALLVVKNGTIIQVRDQWRGLYWNRFVQRVSGLKSLHQARSLSREYTYIYIYHCSKRVARKIHKIEASMHTNNISVDKNMTLKYEFKFKI